MSILAKKINLQTAASSNILENRNIWTFIQRSFCDVVGELTGQEWTPETITLSINLPKPLIKTLADPGLYFGLSEGSAPIKGLISVSSDLAEKVNHKAFGSATKTDVGLLDLLLVRPIAESVSCALAEVFEETASLNMTLTSQNLSPFAFEMPKEDQAWATVTLSIKIEESEDAGVKPAKAKKPKSTKGKTNKKLNTEAFALQFSMPAGELEHLTTTHSAGSDQPILRMDDPWARHFRMALDGAFTPIRAVVETCRLTVAECMRLEIDQVIDLPGVSLQSVGLETELGAGSAQFATGALGIYKSQRAVKLIDDIDLELLPHSSSV